MSKESKSKTLIIAFILAFSCSILVSVAAVYLRPLQNKNKINDRNKHILAAAGVYDKNKPVNEQFNNIKSKMIDIATGKIVDGNVDEYFANFKNIVPDEKLSIQIPNDKDIAGIRRIPKKIPVYILYENNKIKNYILPVYGQGLWSTLYGFIALEKDANTIKGLTFYEHAETPGLGGEIDNPLWKKKWIGKKLYNEKGELAIKVIKGTVLNKDKNAEYKVDGISGATLTSRGVNNLIRFWASDFGFGKFLKSRGALNE